KRAQPTDGDSLQQDIPTRDGFFGQHTDIERIAVSGNVYAPRPFRTQGPDLLRTEGLGNKPIERRTNVGELLWAIDFQITSSFFHLVFHRIGGHDLDIGSYNPRGVRANRHAVPGMRFEQYLQTLPQ